VSPAAPAPVPAPAPQDAAGGVLSVRVRLGVGPRGRLALAPTGAHGPAPAAPPVPAGRVPRVARMVALAHRWQDLLRDGTVRDQAALARLVGVTRQRVTQVLDLLRLAPDVQEEILFLPRVLEGRDHLRHAHLLAVAAEPLWAEQRRAWSRLHAPRRP